MAPPVSSVTVHLSTALRESDPLGSTLLRAFDGRIRWEAIDEAPSSALAEPPLHVPRWAYIESDFEYTPHRQLCKEGGLSCAAAGSRFPLVVAFGEGKSACDLAVAADAFTKWLSSAPRPFATSRVLLVLICGAKPSTLRPDCATALASCLVQHGVGVVEVRDAAHAAEYLAQCAASISESRKRRVPSRFKVAGTRCQTLPQNPEDKLRITWVSQLMQVPGVSEEIAKVIAGRHPNPASLLEAVSRADPDGSSLGDGGSTSSVADKFLADLEYPIRGKKGTRHVGPIISRRVFALFHPATSPEHMLI
eukprot:gnl/TRDRNA2_/TRDRNA2_29876_c0_seq1.p1 gnl/TRDRNA2_/TRDRNA2_29876_c0~~gnl/TRDRNA2_/TRDRNA2_29876_c0_seq1.p1  ORF type:complete len:307 (+),score=38.37 gnl/TRDRNA2_/TRDRNA2_29876_c0_seq1:40-960(+)